MKRNPLISQKKIFSVKNRQKCNKLPSTESKVDHQNQLTKKSQNRSLTNTHFTFHSSKICINPIFPIQKTTERNKNHVPIPDIFKRGELKTSVPLKKPQYPNHLVSRNCLNKLLISSPLVCVPSYSVLQQYFAVYHLCFPLHRLTIQFI